MRSKGYVLAAALGAIGGGVAVALITNAVPKLMQHMETCMGTMMAHMEEKGIDPTKVCPMAGLLGGAQLEEAQGE
jgi:folate-dependent tRNA-U54 methylase TrmFO/GidA